MKQRILFAAQNMAVGGIHTSLVNLLQVMEETCKNQYEIELFTFGKGALLRQVPDSVKITCGKKLLGLSATSFRDVVKSRRVVDIFLRVFLRLWVKMVGSERFYRQMFKKHRPKAPYDIAISYFNDVSAGYFNKGTNLFVSDYVEAKEKIAFIHTDPIGAGFQADVCRETYRKFDRILCVSQAVKEKFDGLVPEYADKTEVCGNRFPKMRILQKADAYVPFVDDGKFHIVTVGRMDNATKRMDGIVRLCKRLQDDGVTNFVWHLVGDGPDLEKDRDLARKLAVEDVTDFCGELDNPFPYMKGADLFALFSRYEGQPMVIGEAMVLGTDILTTNYAAAQEQLGTYGCIAEDDEAFYSALKERILQ